MYRRLILCTLYGAVDFLYVLKKGCWWGGGVIGTIHSEIYYVPIGDGWEEVLVHNVLLSTFLGPNGTRFARAISGPKKSRFSGHTPSNAPPNDVAPLKIITYRAIKTTGTLIVILASFVYVIFF
jgi:hypothetical protein